MLPFTVDISSVCNQSARPGSGEQHRLHVHGPLDETAAAEGR
jgi:hypothetical protein